MAPHGVMNCRARCTVLIIISNVCCVLGKIVSVVHFDYRIRWELDANTANKVVLLRKISPVLSFCVSLLLAIIHKVYIVR